MKKKYALVTKESPTQPGVTFEVEIDSDGDLLVSANGVKVFYVDSENGAIRRFFVTSEQNQAGVSFNANNHIVVHVHED